MKRVIGFGHLGLLALSALLWTAGCQGPRTQEKDPVIQHYVQRRSELLAHRRRLAATYGANSELVARVDRQLGLTDAATVERRRQMIEQEQARQAVRQIKAGTYTPPAAEPLAPVPPATQRAPAQAELP